MTAALRLGTRGSQLALYQAHTVARLIRDAGGPAPEIVVIKTSGDRLQDRPLSEAGGKRLFVKELEDALLRDEIDLAVHSSKDMPALLPPGLTIAGVLPRAEPHDAVVLPQRAGSPVPPVATVDELIAHLGPSPSIGTSSVRRVAQLRRLLPGATFAPIRGNLDTRLRKLDDGEYDAIVLAAAGLIRLNADARISLLLPLDQCVPAPGQGIIAVEVRDGDERVRRLIDPITDHVAGAILDAERAMVEALGGGCQTPIGAIGRLVSGSLHLIGLVVSLDGRLEARAEATAALGQAATLGRTVAEALIEQGAAEILIAAQQGEHA